MRYYLDLQLSLGWTFRIVEQEGFIVELLTIREGETASGLNGAVQRDTVLLLSAKQQLEEYFAGNRKVFSLPLVPKGTEFQRAVWKELQMIPYGETRTYGQIAAAIGNAKASRAVGAANHNNPIGIVIPCHRVIGANGTLTGYGGGLDLKEALLRLEGVLL